MSLVYKKLSRVALGALIGAGVLPSVANAGGNREGTFELVLPVIYSPSTTIDGKGGSEVDLNSNMGLGFGFGYNFTNNFQVGGLFDVSNRGYDATIVQSSDGSSTKASGNLDTSTIAVNATYYFQTSDITPFVSGGLGTTFIDTNIQNGQTSTGCYWDPWWGYICSSYTPTKTETDMTYMAGIGVRWDISRAFSVQGSYNRQWIQAENSTVDLTGLKLDFILRM